MIGIQGKCILEVHFFETERGTLTAVPNIESEGLTFKNSFNKSKVKLLGTNWTNIVEGTIIKGADGQLRLKEKAQPKRKGFAGTVLNLPEGELKLGDRKSWTRFGLTIGDTVWEGNPNEARSNWIEILLSLNNGEVRKESCVETGTKANFLSVFDRKSKTTWWVPFEAIRQVKVTEATSKVLEGVERIAEIYGRFLFFSEPTTISDIKASVEVKLLYPFGKKEYVLRGLVIGTLHFRAGSEWREVPWSSISTIEFQRDDKSTRADQIPLYTYRIHGNYSNVWKEYALPTKSEDKTESKEPNQPMESDVD